MEELLLQNQQQYERVCEKMKRLLIKKQTINHTQPKQIVEGLLLSNYSYAVNKKYLNEQSVTLVVTCLKIQERDRCQEVKYKELLVKDQPDQNIKQYFDQVVELVSSHLAQGQGQRKCLINCFSGRSRSSTLAIAFVMKHNKMSFQQAFDFVRGKCPNIQPNSGFISQLKQYGDELEASIKQKQIQNIPTNMQRQQENRVESAQNIENVEQHQQKNVQEQIVQDKIEAQPIYTEETKEQPIKQPHVQNVQDQEDQNKQTEQVQNAGKVQQTGQIAVEQIEKQIVQQQNRENSMDFSQNKVETQNKQAEYKEDKEKREAQGKQEAEEAFNIIQKSPQKQQPAEEQAQILEQQPLPQNEAVSSGIIIEQGLIEIESQNTPEEKPIKYIKQYTSEQKQQIQTQLEKTELVQNVQNPPPKAQQQTVLETEDKQKQQNQQNPHAEEAQAGNQTTQTGNQQGEIRKKKKKNKKKK